MSINIPNILTITRILLAPLFVILLLKQMYIMALLVFIVAGISDALDGLIARYFNQRTALGAFLDPIADKILLMASFISLAVLMIIPGWLAVIVISRDVLIVTGVGVLAITNIKFEVRPSFISKCTTVAQLVMIILALLSLEFSVLRSMVNILGWVTAALTVISGFHYIYIGMNILQGGTNNHANRLQ